MATKKDDATVEEKVAQLPAFIDVATRLHEVITEAAPDLVPRLWYGMPGYAKSAKGPVICHVRVDDDQYVTFGLTEHATITPDEDADHQLMGAAWFLTELDGPTEAKVADIVRRAAA